MRLYLNMGSDEFIEAWESEKFDDDLDWSDVVYVAMLIPFAQ